MEHRTVREARGSELPRDAARSRRAASRLTHLHAAAPPRAEKATQELRKKGLSAASKKAARHAAEGLVGVAKGPGVAAVVEVRAAGRGCQPRGLQLRTACLGCNKACRGPWWPGAVGSLCCCCKPAPTATTPVVAGVGANMPACLPACLQINSETDFVSRNEQFQQLVGSAAAAALSVTATKPGSSELEFEALQAAQLATGSSRWA